VPLRLRIAIELAQFGYSRSVIAMPEKHTILGGKVHVYRRDNSSRGQCSTYLAGKNRRVSTKEDGLAKAKDFAEDWYLSTPPRST
jgi:hypothetical protein